LILSKRALVLAVAFLAACTTPEKRESAPAPVASKPRPIVVLETDFGTKDDAVALLKGVILSIARDAQVVDLTHEVPPFDIETGAQELEDAPGLFPEGTVFVVVVDPGVGTARKPIAVELENGRFLVGPDNGVLSLAMSQWGVKAVREITSERFQRSHESETFHGRDVFSPCGAHLAIGDPRFEAVGAAVTEWVKLKTTNVTLNVRDESGHGVQVASIEAGVARIDDPYGNIWTNVPVDTSFRGVPAVAMGDKLKFDFESGKSVTARLVKTFGDVKEGEPLAYWNSRGRLSLAINMGDAAKTYGVKRDDKVTISREK
jgi:S-adenosylmethionine hydrolase